MLDILHSWSLYPPTNPRTSTHHVPAPSLSLEGSDLAGRAETQSLGWARVELVALCGRMLMYLKESDERDAYRDSGQR